jgi:autotransporter-associated beta strand protein
MKPRINPVLRSATFAASVFFGLVASSQGQTTYFWDGGTTDLAGNGNGASNPSAAGTWNTTIKNWESGITPYVVWSNSFLDTAVFAGTARTVTLGSVNVGTLNVRTNSYLFGSAVNSGSLTFSSGFIDIGGPSANTVNSVAIRSNLIGSLTVNSSNNTQAAGVALATISGTNTGLSSFTLNLNHADSNVFIDTSVAALGAAGSTVKLTKGILVMNASSALSYNAWNTEFAGGVLRSRGNNAGNAATYNGNGTLTANSAIASLTTNHLTYAGTIDLGNTGRTLTVAPGLGGFIDFTNTLSNSGNILINSNAAGVATGTVRLSAANTFSGNATTTQNLGTLALNHLNALQNATLDTGTSGTQAVTFTVAGANTYNLGALQGSDALAIGGNTLAVGSKAVDTIFNADLSGAGGGLTKVGSNKLTLTAGTSFTGATQITGGTLALTGSGALNNSSGITINGSSAKLLHTGSTNLSPVVTLTNGTLTGSGTVNTVNVGAGTGGILSNNDGASGAALTLGTLTLSGGADINLYSNTTAAALNVTTLTNNATANAVTITANNVAGWTNGSIYNIIDYGTLGGTGAYNFNKVVNNKSARQSETWADDTVNGAITLAINGDNPRWMGDGDGKWNLASTNNWKLVAGGGYTTFLATDDVLFDGDATGTSSIDIDAANVAPNSTIFSNTSAKNYTLGSTGGFGISSGSLTKNNDGSLTIGSNNTYSGPTTLNAGTVTLSGSGTLGSGSALTMNGGQLDLGNSGQSFAAVSITAPAASGDTVLNGSLTGTSYAVSNTSGNVGISANLLGSGAAGFTKSGAGSTTLSGTNTWTGTTAINAGSLVLSGAGTLGNAAALTLGGGALDLGTLSRAVGAVSATAAAANGDTISNGSLTGTSYAISNTSGNAIVSANLLANAAAGFTMSGAGGTATLSGTNTYTGTTAISAGTLKAGTATAFNNTSALSMSGSGTLDLAGNNASFTTILTSAATNTITTTGAGSGTDTLTLSAFNVDAGTGALFSDNGTRKLQVSFTAGGTGSWQATTNANNTYSGGLVLGGSMRISVLAGTVGAPGAITNGAFGKGSITVNDSSQIWFAVSGRTLVNDVIVNSNVGNGNRAGTFRVGTNAAALTGLVISGNINANSADAHFGSDSTADGTALWLSGKLTGNSGFRFFQSANAFKWTTTLNNATGSPNDYAGATTINSAQTTLALGAADQIPNGIGKGNVALTLGTLDLAGFNETINGLSGAGTVDNVATGTTNTLTLGDNNSTAITFSGLIKNTTGSLALAKTGTGTQTISGANTFTGGLTIKSGTIIAATVNTALGGSSAGVANGLGTVTLGDSTGTNAAALLVATTGLNFANPIVLATNGALSLGNTGTAISTVFSGGITGSNDLTLISNATTGTVGLTTAAIDNVGKVTNTGIGSGTTSISSAIGANVTEVIENSATSTLLLSGSNTAFAGNYSLNSGRMAIGAGFAANTASDFNLGATSSGTNNTTLSFVNHFTLSNDIHVRSGNSGTKTLSLGTGSDLTSNLSGTVTLDDNLILDASGSTAAASLTLSGNIVDGVSGAKGLTKNGAGVVILSGTASDFSGSVAINAGELRIANAAALGDSTTVTVGGANNSAMSLAGGITIGAGKDIKIKGGGVGGFFGALATATTNNGISEWQGSVTIDATTGTRIGSQAGTLKITGNIGETTAGSQLVIRNSGSGITILSGSNNYTGETTINASGGELQVSGGSAIHDSGVVNVVNSAGNIFRVTGSETIGALTGGGNTTAKVAIQSSQTLTLANGTQSFGGVIEGSGAVTVSGAVQTLSNINTYTGDTTITAGTLALSGGGSITNSAIIDVQSSATLSIAGVTTTTVIGSNSAQTLQGLGSVDLGSKTLTIGGSGTLAPGASPGTLDFISSAAGKLDFASGSVIAFELGTTSDLIAFSAAGDWLTGSGNATLSLSLLDGFNYAGTYTVFENVTTSGFTMANITGYDTGTYAANFEQSGDTYNLTFTAVPEPGSALLGSLATLALLRRRRTPRG